MVLCGLGLGAVYIAAQCLHAGAQGRATIDLNRQCAGFAEKGDWSLREKLIGQDIVLWAPRDPDALTRLLAQFLRRAHLDQQPGIVVLIAPLGLHVGMGAAQGLAHLWCAPLFVDKWVHIVRECHFIAEPMGMALPGGSIPKHCHS
eukprot:6427809-Pyramimonas_sp.AAC.1